MLKSSFSRALAVVVVTMLFLTSCDSGQLLDLALNPPGRKSIGGLNVGVNNFFVHREFGSINQQYNEIHSVLGRSQVRVLLAWTNDVQPNPNVEPNIGFFDSVLTSIPAGVEVVVVLAHTPNWMLDPSNWVDGNPRKTWVERWLRPVAARYGRLSRVVGFEIWNEPNLTVVASDTALDLENADNYFEMLQLGSSAVRSAAPGKLVVIAATKSIQQDFPNSLNYNKRLRDLGAENLVDVWNVHYYGSSFESVVTSNGVADFLNTIRLPIWVTESGEQGPNKQLAYVETAWPFLKEKIPSIDRFYYYQYASTEPVDSNYGLKTTDPSFPVSDLYIFFSDS